ncbi:MAG: DUF2442 domain-containing protein [Betaproteobacteria bacterium]|nr:DUF2442 domain-containing protein [Betaproteobacteria bacterium]
MRYRLIHARHMTGYVLRLKFSDGVEGDIDLGPELHGTMFEPLRDMDTFKRFRVDPELHNLVWPNGADFAPEFLHDNVRVTA